MPFPNSLLSPSTWRHVGLGLTTAVFALGTLALISPTTAAGALGVEPTTPEGHDINRKSMVFLGIRDVAAASTLLWFYAEGKTREMGVLLSSWVLVCVVDTWVAAEGRRGWEGVGGLVVAAAVMAFVGLGLFQA
ncbi:hypothetical protein C7974DRAFT_371909 [Boeremia exigua]|uniref:uncharacterized protein n=1 Tax=Boeremia exigua TaxID=749465 RepID=UPI001E8D4EBB|nr:uncharacterized protein C7974DRAFT_371909 [Boeremia exigua]KAH6644860.1 hypothetical protein C7974DRAFT_371909 [Boeremia exigua]